MEIKSSQMTQMRHTRESNVDLCDMFEDRDGFATHFVNEETAETAYFGGLVEAAEAGREEAEKLAAILEICQELEAFDAETSWSASALRSLANKTRQKQRLLAEKRSGKNVKEKMEKLHLSIDNLIMNVVCAAPGLDKLVISEAVKAELDQHTTKAIADARIFSKMQAELANWLVRVGLEKREGGFTPRRNAPRGGNAPRGNAARGNTARGNTARGNVKGGSTRDVNGRKRGGNTKRQPVKVSALTGLFIQQLDGRGRKVNVPARRLPSGEIVPA
jgi:hypothetical protein